LALRNKESDISNVVLMVFTHSDADDDPP
jgi:hypothetical protein